MTSRPAKNLNIVANTAFSEGAEDFEAERQAEKPPPPFSLRLSADERALLDAQAGGQPLGAYIRDRLLGAEAAPRRKSRRPRVDEQLLAQVLAELGASRLASNVNQLAKSANIGTLDVSARVEAELLDACAAIRDMRDKLVTALGLRPEGEQ